MTFPISKCNWAAITEKQHFHLLDLLIISQDFTYKNTEAIHTIFIFNSRLVAELLTSNFIFPNPKKKLKEGI